MYLAQEAAEMSTITEDTVEPSFYPQLFALKRSWQFYEFLRNELEACRTETERKVILSVLLTTQLRIENLAASLNLLDENGQGTARAS